VDQPGGVTCHAAGSVASREAGFETASLPVHLEQNEDAIRIKLSNQDNREFRLFAFHVVIEAPC